MTLNRRDQVLKYIVEHFIKTAQPVGSKTLIEEYHLNASPATIRNEMYALEQLGYLEKTHSSSGRIPSAEGYRFYCAYLRNKDVDDDFKAMVETVLKEKSKSIDEIIHSSCEILSHMTNLVSVVLGPDAKKETLASIQLIPLSESSASVIFITNQGYVENRTFVVDKKESMEDLISCLKLLNDRLVGTPINDLLDKMKALKPVLSDYIIHHDIIYKAIMEAFIKFASDRLTLYGKNELFNQPEFMSDTTTIKKLINLLESPDDIKNTALNAQSDYKDGNINIHIGSSNKDNPDVSIITTKIQLSDIPEGTIALIGPKRMDYAKVISALEYLVKQLQDYYKKEK